MDASLIVAPPACHETGVAGGTSPPRGVRGGRAPRRGCRGRVQPAPRQAASGSEATALLGRSAPAAHLLLAPLPALIALLLPDAGAPLHEGDAPMGIGRGKPFPFLSVWSAGKARARVL